MNIDGSYQVQKMLRKMYGGARELFKPSEVIVPPLLTDSFVERFTGFTTAQQMFDECGYSVRSAEEFKAIPAGKWDAFIARTSAFDSWEDMLHAAVSEYSKKEAS